MMAVVIWPLSQSRPARRMGAFEAQAPVAEPGAVPAAERPSSSPAGVPSSVPALVLALALFSVPALALLSVPADASTTLPSEARAAAGATMTALLAISSKNRAMSHFFGMRASHSREGSFVEKGAHAARRQDTLRKVCHIRRDRRMGVLQRCNSANRCPESPRPSSPARSGCVAPPSRPVQLPCPLARSARQGAPPCQPTLAACQTCPGRLTCPGSLHCPGYRYGASFCYLRCLPALPDSARKKAHSSTTRPSGRWQ